MARNSFPAWRRRGTALGQRQIADTVRTLLFREDEHLFDQLDFADDQQFLHPTLFAYLTEASPAVGLPQTLYGLTPRDRRPSRVRITTDVGGRAFLGSVGVIETRCPSAELEFGRDERDGPYACASSAGAVPFRLRPPSVIPGTRIEVTTDIDPLFHRFYDSPDAPARKLETLDGPRDHLRHLIMATAMMRAYCPAVWSDLAAVIRLIVLYDATAPHSFAALSAHGGIFCNVRDGEGEIALLEDIAHQGAHVLFNAFAQDPRRLLAIDPQTPVRQLSSEAGETRCIYEAFHALFTYTVIWRVLTAVHESGALSELQSHEVFGRLGLTLRKFAYDLLSLDHPAAYTLPGRRCYEAFKADCALVRARYGERVDGLDYSGQPYVFDYARFVEANGGPWPILREKAS